MNLTGQKPAQKPPPPIRDKAHISFVKSKPCAACGRWPNTGMIIDAAHISIGRNCMSRKVGDDRTVPLCRWPCHHKQTFIKNELAFWQDLGINPYEIAAQLWYERTEEWPIWWQDD